MKKNGNVFLNYLLSIAMAVIMRWCGYVFQCSCKILEYTGVVKENKFW